MTIYVVGHKNPDTDSVCSAIAYAELKKKQGIDAEPAILGKINPETKFVLEKWKIPIPTLLEDAAGKKIIIVDHSEIVQGPKNLDKAEILEIIDHHRIGDIQTSKAILFISKPVGSTSTVIYDLYKEAGIEPDNKIKGLILSAVISDTKILRSPITTERDKEIAEKLAKELKIDIEEYGKEMFSVWADFDNKTPEELMKNDVKVYNFKKGKAYINVFELFVGVENILKRKNELLEEMRKMRKTYETVVCAIVDIMRKEARVLIVSKFENEIKNEYKKEYGIDFQENEAKMKGVISRKKQIVPLLERVMN